MDDFAQPALALLQEAGVDLSAVRRNAEARTGLATIFVDESGENQIAVAPGANAAVAAADIPEGFLDRWTLFVTQMELSPREVVEAIAMARKAEARIILNLAPVVPITEAALDAATYLVLNAGEARCLAASYALSGTTPRQLAGAIAERRTGPVVVTAGAEGAYLATSRVAVDHIKAPAVSTVDTTGAGDALVGTFAAALDLGMPPNEALRRGVVAGALACTIVGAQSSLPSSADVDAFIEQSTVSI
jgi:ribokinase